MFWFHVCARRGHLSRYTQTLIGCSKLQRDSILHVYLAEAQSIRIQNHRHPGSNMKQNAPIPALPRTFHPCRLAWWKQSFILSSTSAFAVAVETNTSTLLLRSSATSITSCVSALKLRTVSPGLVYLLKYEGEWNTKVDRGAY